MIFYMFAVACQHVVFNVLIPPLCVCVCVCVRGDSLCGVYVALPSLTVSFTYIHVLGFRVLFPVINKYEHNL
jgi:hypothetical protein